MYVNILNVIKGADLNLEELRKIISEKSPVSKERTSEIIRKYFYTIPAYVKILADSFGFSNMKVLDIGSSYGQSLFHWGKNSVGIDSYSECVEFTTAIGYQSFTVNIEDDIPEIGKYQAVFTNNLFEHVLSPHLFLARLYNLLEDDGVLAIGYPVIPEGIARFLWQKAGIKGYSAPEHINFFDSQTAEYTLQRAGFQTYDRFAPRLYLVNKFLSKLLYSRWIHNFSICRKIPGFKYPKERTADCDPSIYRKDLAVYR